MALCKSTVSFSQKLLAKIRTGNLPVIGQSETLKKQFGKQYALLETKAEGLGDALGRSKEVAQYLKDTDKYVKMAAASKLAVSAISKMEPAQLQRLLYAKNSEAFTYTFLRKAPDEMSGVPGFKKKPGLIEEVFTDESGKVDEHIAMQYADALWGALRTFDEAGFDVFALMRTLNMGNFVENLLSGYQGTMKIAMAEAVGKTLKNDDKYEAGAEYENLTEDYRKLITERLKEEGIAVSEGDVKRLVDDMFGRSLIPQKLKWLGRFANESRGLYNILQLSPVGLMWGAVSGLLFMVQSFLVGIPHQAARRISTDGLYKHELIDVLYDELRVLKSDSMKDVDQAVHEDAFNTYSMRGMTAFFDKVLPDFLGKDVKAGITTIFAGGMHNAWDWMIEGPAKRTAIAQALGDMDITRHNADAFLEALRQGKIPKDKLDALRTLSHKQYASFRTASDTLAFSRNLFSKMFFMNVRASYLINRAGDVTYAFERAAKAIADGEITDFGTFLRHLDRNEELRTVFFNTVLAAKIAAYVDRFYDDHDPGQNKAKRVVGYWEGLNDYYAALTANLPVRVLLNPIQDTLQYMEFMEENGKKVTVAKGVEVGAYLFLGNLTRQLFKEFQVADPLINSYKAYAKGFDMEVIATTFEDHWNRVANSAARFSLMDEQVPYGLKKFPRPDDYFQSLLMGVTESNPSLKTYMDLRNVENVESYLNDPRSAYVSMLQNINGLPKWLFQEFKTNGVLDRLRDEMADKDSVMRNLYSGKWDPRVVTKDNVDRFYSELTTMNLPSMALGEDGLKAASEYGINVAKKEAFETQLLKVIDKDELVKKAADAYASGEERMAGLVELMAYSEAKVPGTSRFMLSYVADKYYTELNQRYHREVRQNPKWQYEFSDKSLPPEVKEKNKMAVINELYPAMFVADKQSWYNAIHERMQSHYKDLIPFDNKKQQSFFAALGLMDLVAYGEATSGNPDANYVKNVFALTGKYVQDPQMRMLLANRAMDAIDATAPHPDVASAAKLGFVAGNVEVIDKMLNDPEMVAKHGKVLEESLNKLFGNEAHINKIGSDLVRDEIDEETKKRYSVSRGKTYVPNKYAKSNYKAKQGVESKVPSLIPKLPYGYTPSNTTRYDGNPYSQYSAFVPKIGKKDVRDFYFEAYAKALGEAKTQALVTGYVNRFPGDTEQDERFRLTARAPKLPTQKSQYFQPKRARYSFKKNPFEG